MLGLTQEALGMACGVSFQQIQKYEAAVSRLSAVRLWELSKALGVDVGYFFDGLTPEEPRRFSAKSAAESSNAAP